MSDQTFNIRVRQAEDDTLWAEVLELPGCFATGDNLDELREALEEAISLYLLDDPDGATLKMTPAPHMQIDEMRVKVPVPA